MNVSVTTLEDNQTAEGRRVRIAARLVDASGRIAAQSVSLMTLHGGDRGVSLTQTATVSHPHLWDGRIDPYRYDLYVEVRDASSRRLLDLVHQKVGLRSVAFNASPDPSSADPSARAPFLLNGHPYTLVGVDMHQDSGRPGSDGQPVGWAQSAADIRADVDMASEVGATVIRTSHYQDSQVFYDACDARGILVYTESPINGSTNGSAAFLLNAEDQFISLITQNANHPSIVAWGLGNETVDSPTNRIIFGTLNSLAHELDPARKTGLASNGGRLSTPSNVNGIPDIKGTHPYDYWYGPSVPIERTHDAFSSQPLGVTEFGAGGSAYQYMTGDVTLPVARGLGTTSRYIPRISRRGSRKSSTPDLSAAPFLWAKIVWQMFDMASSGRNEGDHPGVNDKGLVTRDRVRKDAFYFYKASWNDPARAYTNAKVLRISDRFWTVRNHAAAVVTVFSNLGAPTLEVNGHSVGAMAPLVVDGHSPTGQVVSETVPDVYVKAITLPVGDDTIRASCRYAGDRRTYTDSVVWSYRERLSGTPVARVDFVPSGVSPASGYVADTGGMFGAHGAATYGWTVAPGPAFGAAGDAAATGFNMAHAPALKVGPTWEYVVPNGTYDVRIGAGQPGTHESINQFRLEDRTAAIDDDGPDGTDTFVARVTVKDGRLTLSAAPGAVNPRLAFVEINRMSARTRRPSN